MRILGGEAKGRRMRVPGRRVRPTKGVVKKALFELLGEGIRGAKVLDLFAGAGGVGLEALSRGAGEVWFVEKDRRALRAIRENVALLGVEGRAVVRGEDVLGFLRGAARTRFDVVFVDPPYGEDVLEDVLGALGEGGWVDEGGIVVSELPRKKQVPRRIGPWKAVDERTYGDTKLIFWRRDEARTLSGDV